MVSFVFGKWDRIVKGAVNNDFLNCQYLPVIIVPEKDNCDLVLMFTDFWIFFFWGGGGGAWRESNVATILGEINK